MVASVLKETHPDNGPWVKQWCADGQQPINASREPIAGVESCTPLTFAIRRRHVQMRKRTNCPN